MYTKNILKYIAATAAVVLCGVAITSCDDDDDTIPESELYYNLELDSGYRIPCKGINPSSYGNGKKVIIRANGHWTIESEGNDCDWMTIYPMQGDDDGYIRLYAEENTRASERMATFRVSVNGVPQDAPITVVQDAAKPFLNLSTAALTFKRVGGELGIDVDSNVEWEYEISGESADRFTASTENPTAITVKATGINDTGADITATLIIKGVGTNSNVSRCVALTQLYATFFDDFSWVKSEAGVLGWKIASGKKEVRIDQWSAEEKAHGWTSASTWIYSRTGFIKFGKGGYGGDVASPCIAELSGATNVTISWSALGYVTAKNVRDDIGYYYVGVMGPGTITGTSANGTAGESFPYRDADGNSITLNAARFELGSDAWFDPVNDPTGTEVWNYPASQFSIDIEGFTPQSRIVYVVGTGDINNAFQNINSKNSRIFIDNFKVVEN